MKLVSATRIAITIFVVMSILVFVRVNHFHDKNTLISQNSLKLSQIDTIVLEIKVINEWLSNFASAYLITEDEKYKEYIDFIHRVNEGAQLAPDDYLTEFWPAVLAGRQRLPAQTTFRGHDFNSRLESLDVSPVLLNKISTVLLFSEELLASKKSLINTNAGEAKSADLVEHYIQILSDNKLSTVSLFYELQKDLDNEFRRLTAEAEKNNQLLYAEVVGLVSLWALVNLAFFIFIHACHLRIVREVLSASTHFSDPVTRQNANKRFEQQIVELLTKKAGANDLVELSVRENDLHIVTNALNSVLEVLSELDGTNTCLSEKIHNLQERIIETMSGVGGFEIKFRNLPNTVQFMERDKLEKQTDKQPQLAIEMHHVILFSNEPIKNYQTVAKLKLIAAAYDVLIKLLISHNNQKNSIPSLEANS